MPECLKCGRRLKQRKPLEAILERWGHVPDIHIYVCAGCTATWLYSKKLTCPVLLKEKFKGSSKGKSRQRKVHEAKPGKAE